jgi:hypothetical protein
MRRVLPLLSVLVLLPGISPVAYGAKPAPALKIVSVVSPTRAVASDGTVYDFTVQNQTCGPSLTSAVVFGRFFPGPPVSPISSAWQTGIGLFVSLENGDLWVLNESCCTPCYKTGTYMGNVFTVAGAATAAETLGATEDSPAGHVSPNPTAGTSRIEYSTNKAGSVQVRIFDASGRLVRTMKSDHGTAGTYSFNWDGVTDRGERVGGGVYFAKVTLPDGTETSRRVVVAR